ncbi:pheromone-regulated protein PRM7-like [Salmo trutta]|uniref:pheromone-regulated protein PRM7-like n=1 Tax=Salmo trutta TaxID=8032 RepID=UPI0011326425|nr:pheromone-regulated protein PRM7-like [Salmo trutta]
MMDIEHEAFCKLRRSMHSTSPADIDPKVHSIVERAVRSILGEQSNEPRSNLLSPSQVVVEVVPRLLLALWLQPEEGHSEHPILISGMAVGMVAAVVEKLSCMLKDPSPHIPFSLAAAFDSVRSILGRISQSFSTDDLQSPFYMSSVCAFVVNEVQSRFQPPTATLPAPPVLPVAVSTPRPADIQAVVELIRIVVVTHDTDPASSHLEVVKVTPNTEADVCSSHLEVVDITPKTEADPASSHLEVQDITPKTEAGPASSHLEVQDITPKTEADPASSHLNVVDITPNTEADPASSHLEVVDITLNTEADPASSHLNVVDITLNTEAGPASSHLEVQDITPKTETDPASSHLNVVDITLNTEADPASSHLNIVDITPNTEAEPISSLLEVVDITPEERTLTMAVFTTLPADIQAEDVAVVIPDVTPHVTKDVTLDVPCRARKGAVRRLFCRLWRAVSCCACYKEEEEQY